MTTTTEPATSGGLRGLLRSSAGIAVAMAVMNVATYAFQMVAARVLGPAEYGAIASLMALLMVIAVLQLGLQATAARRIAAEPEHVGEIERTVMAATYRASLALGALMLAVSPAVWLLLRLDNVLPAILLALCAVPLTIMGGQAGILQGERRWVPLGLVYLAVGVPRVLIGTICVLIDPSETSAMLGVFLGLLVPAVVGWVALRHPRPEGEPTDLHGRQEIRRETVASSLALLAFFALSNLDIVVARNVLDDHDAGLYAGGLIITKAVLFLPQFVVVILFPSMSTSEGRRDALVRGLAVVIFLGACSTAGVYLLSGLAVTFVGGADYADVEPRLWLFSVLGTLLAALQLLVYSVLARQGTSSTYVVWAGVLALIAASVNTSSLFGLAVAVTLVDATLCLVLLALNLWRLLVRPEPVESPDQ